MKIGTELETYPSVKSPCLFVCLFTVCVICNVCGSKVSREKVSMVVISKYHILLNESDISLYDEVI